MVIFIHQKWQQQKKREKKKSIIQFCPSLTSSVISLNPSRRRVSHAAARRLTSNSVVIYSRGQGAPGVTARAPTMSILLIQQH